MRPTFASAAATPSVPGVRASGRSRWSQILYPAYAVLIVVLLVTPISREVFTPEITWFDKVVHFGLFAGMVALGWWSGRVAGRTLAHAVGLAAGTELLQAPISYRSADPWDFVAGALGACVAVAAIRMVDAHGAGKTSR